MVRTINQSYQATYQAEKKRKIFRKVFLFLVLFLVVVSGLVYGLFFSRLFNVREISIANIGGLAEQSLAARSLVENYLAEKKWLIPRFSNIFLVNSDQISSLIGQQFPALENIKVEKKYFHGLAISVDQREPVGVWCYKTSGQCVYFDQHGLAFDLAGETVGTLFLNVADERGNFLKLGDLVAEPNFFNLILQTNDQLKKSRVAVSKFIIPAEADFRLDLQTTEGWKIYLSTKDDLTRQLSDLNIFLSQKIPPDKRAQLQYIDLTVPNRVYYK